MSAIYYGEVVIVRRTPGGTALGLFSMTLALALNLIHLKCARKEQRV